MGPAEHPLTAVPPLAGACQMGQGGRHTPGATCPRPCIKKACLARLRKGGQAAALDGAGWGAQQKGDTVGGVEQTHENNRVCSFKRGTPRPATTSAERTGGGTCMPAAASHTSAQGLPVGGEAGQPPSPLALSAATPVSPLTSLAEG